MPVSIRDSHASRLWPSDGRIFDRTCTLCPRLAKFLEACDHGITLGCNGAAQLFRMGSLGIPFDEARAKRLFLKACDLGMTAACQNAKRMP